MSSEELEWLGSATQHGLQNVVSPLLDSVLEMQILKLRPNPAESQAAISQMKSELFCF